MYSRAERPICDHKLTLRLAVAITGMVIGAFSAYGNPRAVALDLGALQKLGEIDTRFQSYNVEMVEVTGGRFWAPYASGAEATYRMRGPADLHNPRLRALAKQLGPAYMRVSGTWANKTYVPLEGEALSTPPTGFDQVLQREQWRGVVEFAHAVDASITTSFAAGAGARDAAGVWRSDQAQRLVDMTRAFGGSIAAAEFINEPNAGTFSGLPKGHTADDYARDFRIFRDWARSTTPNMKIIGPGSVGEGASGGEIPVNSRAAILRSEDMLQANPNNLDAVSYHFYGDVSQRCAAMRPKTADKTEALSASWLDLTLRDFNYYSGLRDKYEPGKPMWITETAQAACGGSPWAATFLDSFRYLNQLGLLAQKGVQVVMHNTLAASDYSLIDENSLTPRPNYWAAVLWRRTMGTTVLASPASPNAELRLYAHCLAGSKGGVGVLALNTGTDTQTLRVGNKAMVWILMAPVIDSGSVLINGRAPNVDAQGNLTELRGKRIAHDMDLPGQTIAFIAVRDANNPACK